MRSVLIAVLTLTMLNLESLTVHAKGDAKGIESAIQGKVVRAVNDSVNEPLASAWISIIKPDGRVRLSLSSGDGGRFSTTCKLDSGGVYGLTVSFVGMKTLCRSFKAAAHVNLGTLRLDEYEEMAELVVGHEIPQIVMRDDTVVVNVDAFGLDKDARLDELVDMVPGLEYNRTENKLYYDGELLTEIRFNGQRYDMGDAARVLREVPLEVLQNLKIYRHQEDVLPVKERRSGKELMGLVNQSRNAPLILDLTPNANFLSLNNVMLRLSAGLQERKKAELDGRTLVRSGNNIGVQASAGNTENNSKYGKNYRTRLGANASLTPVKGMNVNINGNLDHSEAGTMGANSRQRFMPQGNVYECTSTMGQDMRNSYNLTASLNWSFSPGWRLLLNLSGNGNYSRGNTQGTTQTFNADPHFDVTNPFGEIFAPEAGSRVNAMDRLQGTRNNSGTQSAIFSLSHNFNKTSFVLESAFTRMDMDNRTRSRSQTVYFSQGEGNIARPNVSRQDILRCNPSLNTDYSVGLTVVQSIAGGTRLNLGYRFNQHNGRNSARENEPGREDYWDWASLWGQAADIDYLSALELVNSRGRETTTAHSISTGVSYWKDKTRAELRVDLSPQRRCLWQNSGRAEADTTTHQLKLGTELRSSTELRKCRLELNYNLKTEDAPLSQLITTADNTNPLFIRRGNRSLKAELRQELEILAASTNGMFRLGLRGSNRTHALASSIDYDPVTGITVSQPVNTNGSWDFRTHFMAGRKLSKELTLTLTPQFNFVRSVSMASARSARLSVRSITRRRVAGTKLSLSYRTKVVGATLTGTYDYNHTANGLAGRRDHYSAYGLTSRINVTPVKHLTLYTDFNWKLNTGSQLLTRSSRQSLLNFTGEYWFLKRRNAMVRLEWRNVLDNVSAYTRTASADAIAESYHAIKGGYVLATIGFRLEKVGKKGSGNSRKVPVFPGMPMP